MKAKSLFHIGLILSFMGCAHEAHVSTGAAAEPHDQQDHPYPAGTVGEALNGYWVDMAGLRKWYTAMASIAEYAQRDSTYHMSLQMTLESSFGEHLAHLERDSVVRRALTAAHLAPKDFALLSGVVAIDVVTRQLVDSLGPGAAPTNVGKDLMAFLTAHRREIDSLDASLSTVR